MDEHIYCFAGKYPMANSVYVQFMPIAKNRVLASRKSDSLVMTIE